MSQANPHNHTEAFVRENRKRVWQEAKRALRRNVKLRLKKGLYDDLREKPKVDLSTWNDNGY